MESRTERARRVWDRRATLYDRGEILQGAALRRTRELLCAGARGRTLEVAVGTGQNLRHYPPQVLLTGIDLSPGMLARAREKAERIGKPVRLQEGDAQEMEFPDRSFDSVVCTLSLCAIPDQRRALAEMYRVLVPGGRLLMADHVEYTRLPFRWVEYRRDNPRRLPRDVAVEIGFEVGHHDRVLLGLVERVVARRPE